MIPKEELPDGQHMSIGVMMFTDKAAILQAAATLAAAEFTVDGLSGRDPIERAVLRGGGPVERLIEILTEMEKRELIPPGLVPSAPDPNYVPVTTLS